MNETELFTYLTNEYNQPFSGWDFSHLHGRMEDIRPTGETWDYITLVKEAMSKAQAIREFLYCALL